MRLKRQKHVRRNVRFYKACCGFREPFKVLCDGNFVHAVLAARVGSLHDSLPALLGGASKPFITRCVIAELKKLGEKYSGTVLAARRLDIAKCNHDPVMSASDCVQAMIGTSNPEHFFVATHDIEIRRKLHKVMGGGLISLKSNKLILEAPTQTQVSLAQMSEVERMRMNEREHNLMQKLVMEKPAHPLNETDGALLASESHDSALESTVKKGGERKEGMKFKRKRPKAPNSLSQKKRKQKSEEALSSGQEATPTKALTKKNARRRQRRRKGNGNGVKPVEA